MTICQRPAAVVLSLWLLFTLAGCTLLSPTTKLVIVAGDNLNPDSAGEPASVVVRVFELADDEAFLSSDFFRLYDDAAAVLEGDLVSVKEMVLRPGDSRERIVSLAPDTRHIAVMAAFRDVDNSQWRATARVNPNRYQTVRMALDGLSVTDNSN